MSLWLHGNLQDFATAYDQNYPNLYKAIDTCSAYQGEILKHKYLCSLSLLHSHNYNIKCRLVPLARASSHWGVLILQLQVW